MHGYFGLFHVRSTVHTGSAITRSARSSQGLASIGLIEGADASCLVHQQALRRDVEVFVLFVVHAGPAMELFNGSKATCGSP